MGILVEERSFLPYCVFLSPILEKICILLLGLAAPVLDELRWVQVFSQWVTGSSRFTQKWSGFLCGSFNPSVPALLHIPQIPASTETGLPLQVLLLPTPCPRVWGWSCYQDSFKISLYNHFHFPRKNDCQLLKGDFNTHPFPRRQKKKKKKIFLVGWLFFSLSNGGCSKIICYILPSMVKGSTQCSCTLLVLSETISIPTFYSTSHLSSASHAVFSSGGQAVTSNRGFCAVCFTFSPQCCARVCVAQCGHWFEPPMAHPWGLVQTGQIILWFHRGKLSPLQFPHCT